jgi:hypothetical protein
VEFVSRGEEVAKRVGEMREAGMKWKEIAGEMGESVRRLRQLWRREGGHEDARRVLSTKDTKGH